MAVPARRKAIRTLYDGLGARNHEVGSFETIRRYAAQEGGFVVVHCYVKTLKKREERRSLLWSGTRTARGLLSREGESNPIRLFRHTNIKVGSFETICRAAQKGDSAVVGCVKTIKNKARGRSL